MSSLPATQRAWRVVRRGPPSNALRLVTDLPVPTSFAPGSVLVKVHAAALNPVDYKLMNFLPNFIAGRPTTAAFELSGSVVNGNGTIWHQGDEIVAHINPPISFKTKQGALAEYTVVPANAMVRRPEKITPIQAAGVLLAGQTAWQAFFQIAGLEDGQSVFINGGSTTVGSFAIQFAKARGCRVTVTASGKNEQYVRGLGADDFIDYTKVNIAEYLLQNPPASRYHVFFETVGLLDNALYFRSEKYIVPGGVFISVGPQPHGIREFAQAARLLVELIRPTWLGGTKRKYRIVGVQPKQADMEAIFALIAKDDVRAPIDSVFEFEDVVAAYQRLMTKHATGKVIIKVGPSVS